MIAFYYNLYTLFSMVYCNTINYVVSKHKQWIIGWGVNDVGIATCTTCYTN